MKTLNICIDIDGTLTEPYYWLNRVNRWFGSNLCEEDAKEYDIHKLLNMPRQAYLDFYEEEGHLLHEEALPRPQAANVLHRLAKHHKLHYVTAREPRMKEISLRWFERHHMPEAPLFLLGSHHKVKKALEIGCDIFVEDRFENSVELSMSGIEVFLIDCNYNRFPLLLNTKRVFDWIEIEEKIQKKICEKTQKEQIA